jgi:hypothetical protein
MACIRAIGIWNKCFIKVTWKNVRVKLFYEDFLMLKEFLEACWLSKREAEAMKMSESRLPLRRTRPWNVVRYVFI